MPKIAVITTKYAKPAGEETEIRAQSVSFQFPNDYRRVSEVFVSTDSASGQLPDFDKLWDYSNPAATETRFRELLPIAAAARNLPHHLQLLTQIARSEGLQRKFDAAHETLDQVAAQLDDALPVVRVRYLLERARVFNSSQQEDQARPLFLEAWETARQAGEDGFAVDAAHMLAIVEPPDEALRWNERALALAESSPHEAARRWLGSLLNNIGWTYHDKGDYARALELFERALAFREQQGEPGPIRIAKWCVARALRSLGRIEEALLRQESLLHEHEAAGGKDGFVWEELGECHLALGHTEQAKQYFALAYAELSQDPWLAESEPQRIERLKSLAS
jgi:tetratricopeptide (TPR) repeat protein